MPRGWAREKILGAVVEKFSKADSAFRDDDLILLSFPVEILPALVSSTLRDPTSIAITYSSSVLTSIGLRYERQVKSETFYQIPCTKSRRLTISYVWCLLRSWKSNTARSPCRLASSWSWVDHEAAGLYRPYRVECSLIFCDSHPWLCS